jgi:predicted ATPase
MLEHPEIHLHPNLQMQMADYFISLALSQKRVIIETHSDHIVNRLVRRIVEDKKLNLNDLIRIYFIIPTPTGSKYEPVTIDPESGIVNWPRDFFDQTASEQQRTIQAGLNKRMSNR